MNALQSSDLGGAYMEISLAKPPSDKKKKEEILRNREKRLMQMLNQRGSVPHDENEPMEFEDVREFIPRREFMPRLSEFRHRRE